MTLETIKNATIIKFTGNKNTDYIMYAPYTHCVRNATLKRVKDKWEYKAGHYVWGIAEDKFATEIANMLEESGYVSSVE